MCEHRLQGGHRLPMLHLATRLPGLVPGVALRE